MILMALVPCVKLDALTLEFKPYVVEGKCLAKHQDVCSIVLRILHLSVKLVSTSRQLMAQSSYARSYCVTLGQSLDTSDLHSPLWTVFFRQWGF